MAARMDIIRTSFLRPDPSLRFYDQKFEFIFLIDNSGSMNGKPLELAKQALKTILKGLPTSCRFNIISFSTSFHCMFPHSEIYSNDTVERALLWITAIQVQGSTRVYEPLKHVYQQPQFHCYLTQIFFITDGHVDVKEEVLALVASNVKHSRTFSLGIGNGVDKDFIVRIAQHAGGLHTFLDHHTPIFSPINEFVKTAIQPAILKPIRLGRSQLVFGDAALRP